MRQILFHPELCPGIPMAELTTLPCKFSDWLSRLPSSNQGRIKTKLGLMLLLRKDLHVFASRQRPKHEFFVFVKLSPCCASAQYIARAESGTMGLGSASQWGLGRRPDRCWLWLWCFLNLAVMRHRDAGASCVCNQENSEKNFSSLPWPWAYFTNGPNAAASIAPTLIGHCFQL